MNGLIYEIYDFMKNTELEGMNHADMKIEAEIKNLLEPLKDKLTNKEYEQLRNMMFSVSYTAGREMFAVGFYYAQDLLYKRL